MGILFSHELLLIRIEFSCGSFFCDLQDSVSWLPCNCFVGPVLGFHDWLIFLFSFSFLGFFSVFFEL